MKLANDILDAANARAIVARNLVLVTAPADVAQEKAAVTAAQEKVGQAFAALGASLDRTRGVTAEERRLYGVAQEVENRYGPVALKIVGLALDGQKETAIATMNADCRPLLAALVAAADNYIQAIEGQARAEVAQSGAAYDRNLALTLAGCAVAALMSVGMTMLLTRASCARSAAPSRWHGPWPPVTCVPASRFAART